ncbi:indole-2-monooxygenase-like [Panicum miliaceum]|uniref:Indole-2-monooxygenase-like n=1 Tax=Panicum miliaceum TaxID=4540 RepID=A0A3L6PTY3_PANMI|nr:indole-2-monooxygenase-like [Panicum miliaceum]
MGKPSSRNEGRSKLFRQLVVDTSPLLGGFHAEVFFPFLARFGVLSKRPRRWWDELLDGLIDDHESKQKPMAAASDPKDKDEDFIHVLLSVRQEYGLTREHIKAILLDVFSGGIDTAASVLEYTVVELMQRPRVRRKLQAEVRSVVPKGQEIVSEADLNLNGMAYLRAVIKESLRLRPVTPLLAPHFSMASCSVDGFVVPAGVRVLVNVWAIGRNARYWGEDAEEFVPERFLDGGNARRASASRGTTSSSCPSAPGAGSAPG